MTQKMINFPSTFTDEQLEYIGQSVVAVAKQTCGDRLRGVILYGSYARGDFQEWSDVDIMVLADADDSACRQFVRKIIEELVELNHHMNLLLSVLVKPYQQFEHFKRDYAFYRNVDKEGIPLCIARN